MHQADSVGPALGTTEASSVAESTTATMSFLETSGGYEAGFSASLPSESYSDATPDVGLSEFFSRPVRIHTYTWNESDPIGTTTTINPWSLFFNSAPIKDKLAYYAFLKCDLKVKVMLNASPFYFGATLVSYQPLPAFHAGGIIQDAGTRFVIPLSQRPHLWLFPQNNEGGEMTLPFLFQKNWLSTLSAQEFVDMGALSFTNVVSLDSANGVSGTGVTISVYAWAENVVVSGPTNSLLLQSDEYGKGSVSAVASAIATAMKALEHVPIIGKYATATQMGASATAAVASSLGFCNPPVISDIMPFKPSMAPPLASTEISFPVEKLTVDPKNELSVDPAILGLPSHDELNIKHIITKESYLTTFPWSSANSQDTLLFSSVINPIYFDRDAAADPLIFFTPMGWVGQLFQYWRGDVILRFRFICSQYHRGRVRITYDPSGSNAQNILNAPSNQTTCFNEIVDLTKDTNVEIRVPYTQALAWCKTIQPKTITAIPYTVGSGTAFNHVPGTTNGVLTVRCVTALTAPVASSTISCLVSVRAADNLEFAGPADVFYRYSYFQAQSLEYDATESTEVIAGHAPSRAGPNRYLVNHGEQVVSLRQLLHRYNYVRTLSLSDNTTVGNQGVAIENFSRMPPSYGYDPGGINTAKGIIATATNFKFNYVANTSLSWLAAAYVGMRGSVNWMVNCDSENPIKVMSVSRQTYTPFVSYGVSSYTLPNASTGNAQANFWSNTAGLSNSQGGAALNSQLTNSMLTFAAPMYSAYKMNVTSPANATAIVSQDDSALQSLRYLVVKDNVALGGYSNHHWYASAGTDFSLHFFLNVPTVCLYATNPIPV